jgi:hypothetical protein
MHNFALRATKPFNGGYDALGHGHHMTSCLNAVEWRHRWPTVAKFCYNNVFVWFAKIRNIFYKHLAMLVFNITGLPFPARHIIRPGCRQTHQAVLSD